MTAGFVIAHLIDGHAVRSRTGPDVDLLYADLDEALRLVTPDGDPAYSVVELPLNGDFRNRALIPRPAIRWVEKIITEE